MSTSTGPRQAAQTGKRRFWVDPRFVVGILLIAASVVGVCVLLATQNRSVEVYTARNTLVAGDRVRPGDLELTSVRVPSASDVYLTRAALPRDAVVVRSVPRGELVPASAVGETADAALTSVVVKASGPAAAAVDKGAVVDVWAAHSTDDKDYRPPTVLVPGAVVASVARDDSLVADRSTVSIEMRVPSNRVASVLQAIADGRALSVVPASTDSGAGR
ncbi:hypothetical protein GCM10027568_02220 [Humibacter soli]